MQPDTETKNPVTPVCEAGGATGRVFVQEGIDGHHFRPIGTVVQDLVSRMLVRRYGLRRGYAAAVAPFLSCGGER